MFSNLIESSSHAREFKRRGSFVLFTTATYALLFIIAGVASIYAYDARLDDQNIEITILSPLDLANLKPEPTKPKGTPARGATKPIPVVRANNFVSINHPEIVPDTPSVKPNPGLPVPEHGSFTIGSVDSGPGVPGGTGRVGDSGDGGDANTGQPVVEIATPPPDPPIQKPVPRIISKGPLAGYAISLPKPPYPQIAKQMGAHGAVNVQVLVDETGRVVSARAVSGHPMLQVAAQQAALAARFSPTMLGDQAVKVSGVITYNFVLQ
jgi:protein TonB